MSRRYGYFGSVDKKECKNILDNGLAYLKDKTKECRSKSETKSLWNEFARLDNLLYCEGRDLLSMTDKVRFEKRLNTIRKMIEELDKSK